MGSVAAQVGFPASDWGPITPSDETNQPAMRAIYLDESGTEGTVEMIGESGHTLTKAMVKGERFPCSPKKITTNTTADGLKWMT